MPEPYWYYMKDNQPAGPVVASEMRQMLEDGELGVETLVWSDSTVAWTPASEVEALGGRTSLSVTRVPQTSPADPVSEDPEARPWVRFWARQIDLVFAGLLLSALLTITPPSLLERAPLGRLTSMAVVYLWVFVETFLLSTWGTTPGKWFLKIRLRDATGKPLSFRRARERSIAVWWSGMGIGFPLAALATLYVSYGRLREDGVTPWDRRGRLVVSHEPIGIPRILTAVLLVVGFRVWVLWGGWDAIAPNP
jgi:uncharacterized RDD family membrane protein YckC